MKLSILLITLFSICFSFNIHQSPTQTYNQDPLPLFTSPNLQDCTPGQAAAVNTVIATCEVSDLDTSIECISNQVTKVYGSQQWNIFAKNTVENKDTVVIWRYNNCLINLVNYGKFNRTYILWPVKTYLNASLQLNTTNDNTLMKGVNRKTLQKTQQKQPYSLSRSLQQQPNADCPSWKTTTINKLIKSCSIDGNQAAARCIFDKVKQQIGEYWNVGVQTSLFGTSLEYFYYGGCDVQTDASDSYRRYYYVWKAHV